MDPKFQTSFIPKKPLNQSSSYGGRTIGVLPVISTLIFLIALIVAGGLFAYEIVLKDQIGGYQNDLERARAEFDPTKIDELLKLDKRIETTKKLLAGHWSVSKFFKLLEASTLKTVQFTNFDFALDDAGAVKIIMRGRANSFSSVALQSDRLNSDPMFKDTIISDIELEELGTVSFLVTTSVDPKVLSYRETITASGVSGSTQSTGLQNPATTTQNQGTGTNQSSGGEVTQTIIETTIPAGNQNQQSQ